MTEKIKLRMEKMVYGGSCLARREDGKAVFVPFTLPGELVEVIIVEEKKGHANARLVDILEASADRIEAECEYYMACGGCHYQHISYDRQLAHKEEIFKDQLVRLGGVEAPNVQPMIGSPDAWNYRSRAQFHQDRNGKLGFMAASSNEIVPIDECPLLSGEINELLPQLEMEFIPELNRIEVREGDDGHLMVVFQSEDPIPPEMELDLDVAVVHLGSEGPYIMADSLYQQITVSGKTFRVSAPGFFQVNLGVAEKLVELVREKSMLAGNGIVFDLFCGVGLFSAIFAEQAKELVAVESSEFSCEDFVENLDDYGNITLYQDEALKALGAVESKPDLVVLDPPRSGLSRKLRDRLIELNPPEIIYISCDPSTLARDIKRFLQAGYQLKESIPLDMFPQTKHIESLTVLHR